MESDGGPRISVAGGANLLKGQGLKKHKWIPLVVIVVLALVLILIQYFMIDILMAVNTK